MAHDAEIHFWRFENDYGYTTVRGIVFGDKKGRFADGDSIRTSPIVDGNDKSWCIKTKNSVYRLVPRSESLRLIELGRAQLSTDERTGG